MKKLFVPSVFLIILFCLSNCTNKKIPSSELKIAEGIVADTPVNPASIAKELIKLSSWNLIYGDEFKDEVDMAPDNLMTNKIKNFQRQMIKDNIFHYKFQIPLGSNQHDVIGIHRVVKEVKENQPQKTGKTIFLQHGDAKNFEGMYLPGIYSTNTPDDFGIAVYLAENDVDVWGIDQAWTLVPKETSDFSFMSDWGLQRQIDDLRTAMAIARFSRLLTDNGFNKLILSGYSSGVASGYSLLNEETQKPPELRHVNGYIPVDLSIKNNDETALNFLKNQYTVLKTRFDKGEYQETIPFQIAGNLARTDPDGNSPILAGMTNLQTALFFGAGKMFGELPFHYLAGVWENTIPTDLQYVTKEQWFDFLESGVPYEALLFMVEYTALMCDAADVPFDDYFSEIEVPILNIAPMGGFGKSTIYGTTLLGSKDVIHHIIELRSPKEISIDYGHIDLFIGKNAEKEVWQPILKWIKSHTNDYSLE